MVRDLEAVLHGPRDRYNVMNVAGFEEALAAVSPDRIGKDLSMRLRPLPGLTLLKPITWKERNPATSKDAVELYRPLTAYAETETWIVSIIREKDIGKASVWLGVVLKRPPAPHPCFCHQHTSGDSSEEKGSNRVDGMIFPA
jgi:hypothetical protein